jgi:uncharacterized protein (DUF58 family)
VLLYDGDGTSVVPPRGGRDAVLAVLHRLEARDRGGSGRGSLRAALQRARLLGRRRGLVVVVSDLLDDEDWTHDLRALSARHDVVVAQITDPRDAELPKVGLLTLVDPETGERLDVQTSNPRVRARFAAAAAAQREATRRRIRAGGASHLAVSTDRDWLLDVVRFAAARRRRR